MQTIEIKGNVLKDARKKMGVDQKLVEEKCGIPNGRLTQYECERSSPTPEILSKLCAFYKISPISVMSDRGYSSVVSSLNILANLTGVTLDYKKYDNK